MRRPASPREMSIRLSKVFGCSPKLGLPVADMDEDYKGHHIQSVPRHLLPDSNRWTAHVVINWTARSREQFREFDVKRGFATQEDAEMGGLIFARKWIADGKPKLRKRGTAALNEREDGQGG